jgi:hypothetical protein
MAPSVARVIAPYQEAKAAAAAMAQPAVVDTDGVTSEEQTEKETSPADATHDAGHGEQE